jgi:hypothetical protein
VERFGRSKFGFGGVDPRVLFIPSYPGYIGLTSALDRSDQCEPLVGFALGELLDSYGWQRVQNTRVPVGKNPLGRGYGFYLVPTGKVAGLYLCPRVKY